MTNWYRIRVKGYNVMLLCYEGDRLIETFHFVNWFEVMHYDSVIF